MALAQATRDKLSSAGTTRIAAALAKHGLRRQSVPGLRPLTAHQDVLGGKLVDRLAHRSLAHAEARRQLDLRRDGLAGLPFARDKALGEQDLDLLV